MPFLRIVTEPEYWTTPHVKNSKLKQDGKKITIPIQWYLNPNYQDKATKEQKEKKFKQLELQYDQIRNKAVADWDQDEQKLFLEYQAVLTDRNREVMEAMEMEKKLGQSLLDRHKFAPENLVRNFTNN